MDIGLGLAHISPIGVPIWLSILSSRGQAAHPGRVVRHDLASQYVVQAGNIRRRMTQHQSGRLIVELLGNPAGPPGHGPRPTTTRWKGGRAKPKSELRSMPTYRSAASGASGAGADPAIGIHSSVSARGQDHRMFVLHACNAPV